MTLARLSIPGCLCVHCDTEIGESVVCPGCGWVDPLTRRGRVCSTCDGEGEDICQWCDGYGDVEVWCDTIGCSDIHWHECEDCNGTGYNDECPNCNGTGVRPIRDTELEAEGQFVLLHEPDPNPYRPPAPRWWPFPLPRRCAWCKRWLTWWARFAAERLGIPISHGACDRCSRTLLD